MSRPTLVYYVADADKNVWVQCTKDLEVAVLVDQETLGRPLRVVRVEEFPTMLAAHKRIERIGMKTVERRRKLIERGNPDYAEVATVEGTIAPVPLTRFPPDLPDDGGLGVGAGKPIPLFPRGGADAKKWPTGG